MTEFNIFCYSEQYNDDNSFQQKSYRIFNKEIEEKEYYKIGKKVNKILENVKLEPNKNTWQDEWKIITKKQWEQLMDLAKEIRGDDFKKGFEFISEIEIL